MLRELCDDDRAAGSAFSQTGAAILFFIQGGKHLKFPLSKGLDFRLGTGQAGQSQESRHASARCSRPGARHACGA